MMPDQERQTEVQKRPYEPPKLEIYGPIAKLTRGGGRNVADTRGPGRT